MREIIDEANRLRKIAHAGPIGKRHSSFELYDILQKCMALAIRCHDQEAFATLEKMVRDQPTVGKGRWLLSGSDEYLLVCRYVFPRTGHGRGELSNASRYASCLRQAAQRQIRCSELAAWLRENGGVNALFLRRPLKRRSVFTKILHLTKSIEVPKDGEITLTLRRTPENSYDVISVSVSHTNSNGAQ